jgi:hypothetical protein
VCMCRPTGYELGSTQKYICCFIRVTHAIKLCVLETEEFFELMHYFNQVAVNKQNRGELIDQRLYIESS